MQCSHTHYTFILAHTVVAIIVTCRSWAYELHVGYSSPRKCSLYHFSVRLAEAGLVFSGGSYFLSLSRVLPGGAESENWCMNSTPPTFHSPALSTKMAERQMLRWTRPQSTERKLMAFCEHVFVRRHRECPNWSTNHMWHTKYTYVPRQQLSYQKSNSFASTCT